MARNDFDWFCDIYKLDRVIRQAAGQSLEARLNLSLSHAKVIEQLTDLRKSTQVQLAERLECDCGSLSRLTARMVEKGLLEKQMHEQDGRCASISLTEYGREKGVQIRECLREAENLFFSSMSDAESRRLVSQLKRLIENSMRSQRIEKPAPRHLATD